MSTGHSAKSAKIRFVLPTGCLSGGTGSTKRGCLVGCVVSGDAPAHRRNSGQRRDRRHRCCSGSHRAEEASLGAAAGTTIAPKIVRKVRSVRVAPVADLVAGGQITSPEVLAAVLPQVTADLHAKGLIKPSERTVYAALYRAFRARRSLLLFDFQSQVRVEELPWASALPERRTTSQNDEQISLQALRETAALTLTNFPQTQLPNAMIEEMMRLAQRANLDAPVHARACCRHFHGSV